MADHDTDFWNDADNRYYQRRRARPRRIDPFFARVIALALAGVLLIPVALSLRHDTDTSVLHTGPNGGGALAIPGAADDESTTTSAAASTSVAAAPFVVESTVAPTIPTTTIVETTAAPTTAAPTIPTPTSAAPTTAAKAAATTPAPTTAKPAAPSLAPRSCTNSHKVVAGDSWTRIAQQHGVKLAALLAANGATAETSIFPGNQVCLPASATPTKATTPTTAAKAPATTAAPTTTKPKVPATTAPATTAAPETTIAARKYSRDEVIAIIRATWPDELEDKAITIATRESNLVPSVKNSCCYGLFQIYFSVHKSWLAGLGVTSASQLYDPHTNASVALALYQRSGGWGPWGG